MISRILFASAGLRKLVLVCLCCQNVCRGHIASFSRNCIPKTTFDLRHETFCVSNLVFSIWHFFESLRLTCGIYRRIFSLIMKQKVLNIRFISIHYRSPLHNKLFSRNYCNRISWKTRHCQRGKWSKICSYALFFCYDLLVFTAGKLLTYANQIKW